MNLGQNDQSFENHCLKLCFSQNQNHIEAGKSCQTLDVGVDVKIVSSANPQSSKPSGTQILAAKAYRQIGATAIRGPCLVDEDSNLTQVPINPERYRLDSIVTRFANLSKLHVDSFKMPDQLRIIKRFVCAFADWGAGIYGLCVI